MSEHEIERVKTFADACPCAKHTIPKEAGGMLPEDFFD